MNVGFGIVGTGSIAALHAQAIELVQGATLVSCHSRREETGKRFASEHSCDYSPTLQDLLTRTDCDVIVVTTPSGSHAEIGIRAAEHGKHVLCEKPLDISVEKIDRLIAACEERQVLLGAVFQSRFGAGARALKRAIDRNRFGRLTQCSAYIPWFRSDEYYASADWRGSRDGDGGELLNQGVHAVDLLLWLAGDVEEVSARTQTRLHEIEVEDNAVAWLQFANGSLGVIQSSTSCYPGESKRVEIKGEFGSVTLVDDVPTFWEFSTPASEDEEISELQKAAGAAQGSSDPKAITVDGHLAQYRDFIEAVREDRQPAISGAEARRSVRLIEAIYESNRLNQPVRV